MRKIDSLRQVLSTSIEDLSKSNDRLRVWTDRGTVQCRQTSTFGFMMSFRAKVLLMDMTTDIAAVCYVLCAWLRIHQPDLLAPGKEAFTLDHDVIDNSKYDALIEIDLTQNVTCALNAQGKMQVDYLPEPDPLFADDLPFPGLDAVLCTAVTKPATGTPARC
ncbi:MULTISPECIES: phage tail protein [unclassified Novosphingobium]|uniref:phage tail protein n=1 Tax=unclassified Novosphingobium TaxID=2644732 RepID=UPI000D3124DE|nr:MULTISPECIES: phage tail protein [unclassified Novosphingobium]PTR05161.1 tail completion protein R (GpR) [Novosphingobium sp. GV055]PUA93759.1 tail completion protein R (GpR) [Novosphingobium sp. GV061]PUB10652.1 tail completion protein R (GpR) [Novosphingobium sp. GV079]PUB35964.1 tail completion protein R (GpR) [Novosphingobium sp. GV027]